MKTGPGRSGIGRGHHSHYYKYEIVSPFEPASSLSLLLPLPSEDSAECRRWGEREGDSPARGEETCGVISRVYLGIWDLSVGARSKAMGRKKGGESRRPPPTALAAASHDGQEQWGASLLASLLAFDRFKAIALCPCLNPMEMFAIIQVQS